MVEPWRSWDAGDDEYAELTVLREGLPPTLKTPVLGWLSEQLTDISVVASRRHAKQDLLLAIQSMLRIDLGARPPSRSPVAEVMQRLDAYGDRTVLRVVDILVARFEPDGYTREMPGQVSYLAFHFDVNSSAIEIALTEEGPYRLRRRVPAGVRELVEEAITGAAQAGALLVQAWAAAYGLEPNPSGAMTLAVRAVEAAAKHIVVPTSKKGFIGEIAQTIEAQREWELNLYRDGTGYPDHNTLLALSLRTLAKAQTDRHGVGSEPAPAEAQAHVQLASTLVAWFSSGAVRRRSSA